MDALDHLENYPALVTRNIAECSSLEPSAATAATPVNGSLITIDKIHFNWFRTYKIKSPASAHIHVKRNFIHIDN